MNKRYRIIHRTKGLDYSYRDEYGIEEYSTKWYLPGLKPKWRKVSIYDYFGFNGYWGCKSLCEYVIDCHMRNQLPWITEVISEVGR